MVEPEPPSPWTSDNAQRFVMATPGASSEEDFSAESDLEGPEDSDQEDLPARRLAESAFDSCTLGEEDEDGEARMYRNAHLARTQACLVDCMRSCPQLTLLSLWLHQTPRISLSLPAHVKY